MLADQRSGDRQRLGYTRLVPLALNAVLQILLIRQPTVMTRDVVCEELKTIGGRQHPNARMVFAFALALQVGLNVWMRLPRVVPPAKPASHL